MSCSMLPPPFRSKSVIEWRAGPACWRICAASRFHRLRSGQKRLLKEHF